MRSLILHVCLAGLIGLTFSLFAPAQSIILTVAGNGNSGYNGDNIPATSAELNLPYGVAVNASSNLYIADASNNRVREVTASTGIITTLAGTGNYGYNGDNIPATSAELFGLYDVAVDASGNLYISDAENGRIRKVTASTGVITTVAGNGTIIGYNSDNIPATSASLFYPYGVAVGAQVTYISLTLETTESAR